MARTQKTVCFIDDQRDEIDRFCRSLGRSFIIGAGTSIQEALRELTAKGHDKPDIFLVDMYHGEVAATATEQPRLNQARANFLRAEAEFNRVLKELRQDADGGFRILRDLRSQFRLPSVPVAFFTRKGTLDNALRAYEDEIPCPIIKKPDPSPEEVASGRDENLPDLYDRAFDGGADRVAADIERVIRRSSFWVKYGQLLIGAAIGYLTSILSALTFKWIFN